ncbi:hypothetical protein G5V59_13020 [Nocardioides sp. W3-2-3]|nr:hypothetical protein [Nocardioides convexus]
MNKNEKPLLGLAGGLALTVVARQVVFASGRGLGLTPPQIGGLVVTAGVMGPHLIAKGGRR